MSRITWDSLSERFYETGVDRGVLYVSGSDGVAWPGLISITESPSGGDAKPYYIDGVKYLNLAAAEEYEATIVSLSNPKEFLPCDGVASIQNGLFATQQIRSSFGFSYRNFVGNAIEGEFRNYKIHLVYNALAAPAERNRQTLSSSSSPESISWNITTLAPEVTGVKRTAHYVIDSRYTDPEVLASVEDVLYGTDISAASLPSPDDLIALFA